MLFKPELAQAIADLRKTQTRRPLKAGEKVIVRDGKTTLLTAGGRIKYQVGRDYAVQYAYGKPCRFIHRNTRDLMDYDKYQTWAENDALNELTHEFDYIPMRIRVTDLWLEDVRTISLADAIAESFDNELGFWSVWCGFYDSRVAFNAPRRTGYVERVREMLESRPDSKYQGVAYRFELLGVSS